MREDMMDLTKGTEIFYNGDMANDAGFGIIAAVSEDRWGTHLQAIFDDGRVMTLSPCQFHDKYLGHAGTRFVTKAAYDAWRAERLAAYR